MYDPKSLKNFEDSTVVHICVIWSVARIFVARDTDALRAGGGDTHSSYGFNNLTFALLEFGLGQQLL